VRKELHPFQQDDKAEADLLFFLGSLRHPNLVELLTAYVHRGVTNLLFEPADFDLDVLIQSNQRPKCLSEDFFFLQGMKGLASGLASLHNFVDRGQHHSNSDRSFFGYHHDIKPRNVLVRGSKFILADFGLSKLKQLGDDSKTPWRGGTYQYGPPECRDPASFEPGIIGRASDIWSFGCVLAEVAAYLSAGSSGVRELREQCVMEGEYGAVKCFHDGKSLSNSVDNYLQSMESSSTSRCISSLIIAVRGALSESPTKRPHAKQLETELARIAVEGLLDKLVHIIEHDLEQEDSLVESNLFQALFVLEQHRLQAWATVLGLSQGLRKDHQTEKEAEILMSHFYETLISAYTGLTSPPHFETIKNLREFYLTLLRQTNDELCTALSEETRLSIDSIFLVLTTHQKTEQCIQQSEALHGILQESKDPAALAAMRYMSLKLGKPLEGDFASHRIEGSLLTPDLSKFDVTVRPQTWFYSYGHQEDEQRPTLVEFVQYWKSIRGMTERSEEFKKTVDAMFQRVQELVSLLKMAHTLPGFRVLDCLGTFHDAQKQRFGLVYGYPEGKPLPVRLNSLLRRGRNCPLNPDPAEKLNLAQILVACVQNIHTSGWVHKAISSLNVIFFPLVADKLETIDLGQPFVIGFDHSRKDGKEEYSIGPDRYSLSREYLYPEYRNGISRARQSFDYYSLGLVLFEIGLWQPISNIHEQAKHRASSPDDLRCEYIRHCSKSLRKIMGPTYEAATRTCLQYGSKEDEFKEQIDFQESVVSALSKCSF